MVTTGLFALLFRFLPDVRLRWRDVTTGAVVTAVLFTIGQQVIGLYLGQSSVTSSYGAAGSMMILLLWVYYSCQIVLFGAEFTRVYAQRRVGGHNPNHSPKGIGTREAAVRARDFFLRDAALHGAAARGEDSALPVLGADADRNRRARRCRPAVSTRGCHRSGARVLDAWA